MESRNGGFSADSTWETDSNAQTEINERTRTFADETKCSSVVITCISVKVLVAAQFIQQLQE